MVKSVFISSTSLDLKKYRQAAIEACVQLGFLPIAMESFEAMGVGATEGSKRKLREADLYVGIIAYRYGYIEAGYDRSVTEIEFEYAGERGLDRLCFVVDPNHGWPKRAIERRNAARLAAFKARIDRSVIRATFSTVEDFRHKLVRALVNWQEWRTARSGEQDALLATLADDIPGCPDRLIGRDALLAEINALLDKGRRVLLQGFGGMGKTALAACVAAGRISAGQGPVLWLRAGTEGRDDLLTALARPFNAGPAVLRESGIASQARVVRLLLAERGVKLVVLDDVWNARALAQLVNVNAIPAGVPLLVTSRQRFPGLTRLDVGRLDRRAALELLCQTGDAAWAGDPDAAELCARLGDHTYAVRVAGLTLALDGLKPRALLDRIGSAPWKLAAPDGGLEEGRSSVEELLTTSLYGLDEEARATFQAFGAFFSAGATPELLALYQQGEPAAVEDALNRLQRRGLAERAPEVDGRLAEYRVHDLAYSYARAQITEADRGRALDACLAYLARYRDPKPEHFPALRSELDNLMGAAAWALAAGRPADVQRLADGLHRGADGGEGFLHLQGYAGLAVTLLEQAVSASEQLAQRDRQADYLGHLGSAYRDLGQVKQGMKHYRAALKLYRELKDEPGEGITLGRIGIAYRQLGQAQPAIEHLELALAIARRCGDHLSEGISLANLGIAYRMIGRLDDAQPYLEGALTLARSRGDRRGEAINLGNLGDILRDTGHSDQALEYYQQALAIALDMGDRRGGGINLGRLGDLHRSMGRLQQAVSYLEQALAIARETGDKRGEAINLGRLGDALRDRDDMTRALEHHERALNIARQMDDRRGEGFALFDLGGDYRRLDDRALALDYYQQARAIFDSLGLSRRVADVDRAIGDLTGPGSLS